MSGVAVKRLPCERFGCPYQKLDLVESGVGDELLEDTGGSVDRTALVLVSKSRAFQDGPGRDRQLFGRAEG